jgi:hypothetical protein
MDLPFCLSDLSVGNRGLITMINCNQLINKEVISDSNKRVSMVTLTPNIYCFVGKNGNDKNLIVSVFSNGFFIENLIKCLY